MFSCKIFERKFIVGLILIVISIILSFNTNLIYQHILNGQLIINPSQTYSYNLWKETPFPITTDIYFFNWTNPEDITNPSIKPRLQEIGPYRFNETKTKVDVVWHDNGTITFRTMHFWYFDEENSVGSLDDKITTLDAVALSAAAASKHFNYLVQKTLSVSLRGFNNKIHTTKRVGELLFDGYDDPLINIAKSLPKLPNIDIPPFNKFGWFVDRNGSKEYEGVFTMGTGENEAIKFGEMYEWNGDKRNRFYTDECSKVSGSAGEFFPQNLPQTEIYLFFSDLCRAISLQFSAKDEYKNMRAYKYTGGEKTFENGTKYPENGCFCDGECPASGITSVQKCRYGAPGYISFPHFYAADPVYLEPFEGLQPEKDKHQFYVYLEPRTGIPLYVDGKFQANLLLEPNPNIALYNNVPKLYFPVLWFRERVTISDEVASAFKVLLAIPVVINCIALVIALIGIILIAIVVFSTRNDKPTDYEIQTQIDEAERSLRLMETK